MSRERILTVIPELGVGGAEAIATALALHVAATGRDAVVASTSGHRVAALEAAGVPHVPLPLVGRGPVGLLRSVARLQTLDLPDLVHAHNPKATLVAGLAFGRRVPVLTTLHGVADRDVAGTARILRRFSYRVVVVAPHLARALEREGLPGSRIEVVPTALDPLPSYSRARARAELDLAPEATVVLCLARMVPQKRHDLLLQAWPAVADRATLLLAGGGPRQPDVVAAATPFGAGVRVLGERSDVARLLAAADLLVLPTDWEGLPVAVLEALGAGVPVLASAVPGLVEHVGDSVRLVQPGSVSALAGGLTDLVDRPAVRHELAELGRALLARRFCAARMLAQYDDNYLRLVGSGPGRRTRIGVG